MRKRAWGVAVMLGLLGSGLGTADVRAQENPEQLKKAYDDALVQLRAAQERKNQLAAENEKLKQQVESLKGEVANAHARIDEYKRVESEQDEKTWYLRSHYSAWQQFLKLHPDLLARWRTYLGNEFLVAPRNAPGDVYDPEWPLSLQG